MIVERLKALCDEKGVSFVQFERESGIGIYSPPPFSESAMFNFPPLIVLDMPTALRFAAGLFKPL